MNKQTLMRDRTFTSLQVPQPPNYHQLQKWHNRQTPPQLINQRELVNNGVDGSRDRTVVQREHSIASAHVSLSGHADRKGALLTNTFIDNLRKDWTANVKPDDGASESCS